MTAPAVSVIIPVWDAYAGPGLLAAVASVEGQPTAWELVVVDNASTVALPEIPAARVVTLASRASRGAARNAGLRAARAPFVVFLDADDVLMPGALASLLEGIASRPGASAYVMSIVDGRTGERHRSPRPSAMRLARRRRTFAAVNAVWSLLPVSGCAIMPAELVRDCGGFGDADHGEDWELGVSLAFAGPVVFDERPALVYHLREDSPGAGETSPRVLLDNARRVRARIAAGLMIPGWGRALLPAIALAQALAVLGLRPLIRSARARVHPRRPRPPADRTTIRLVRIIARLNIGGPAIQAITLTSRLEGRGYRTRLVRGREGAQEGSMDYLADELGVVPTLVPRMRRDPGPGDLAALARLAWILRRDRPALVHTHAAKGGTLGRLATLIAYPRRRRRPVLVHTYHGHSLTGYFSSRTARFYAAIERALARRTDALVAVSGEVRDDLVRLGIAEAQAFTVIPLGFDLARFAQDAERQARRTTVRAEWGLDESAEVITLIARLVPIKRVDRFLRVALLLADRPRARFVIVGDGELRDELHASAEARALGDRVVWAGFRDDIPAVCFASDVVVLTSDNEGTPVSLIEAQAAAVPVVSTDVGGVRSTVLNRETGILAGRDDVAGLAAAAAAILDDSGLAAALGAGGRRQATARFTVERLVDDHDRLYRALLVRVPALL